MKKIFLGLIILFFTTSVFSEMKQTVKVGEVAKFGYGFFPLQENVITGVRKEGNIVYLNVATKEKNSYSQIYLQYVFENNEVTPYFKHTAMQLIAQITDTIVAHTIITPLQPITIFSMISSKVIGSSSSSVIFSSSNFGS